MKRRELLLGMGLASAAIPLYVRATQTSECNAAKKVRILCED
jgi:hypothetical protein